MKIGYGTTSNWGFGIAWNPDYRDVSIDFIHWYIAIGLGAK
jgi:hypothetical protein